MKGFICDEINKKELTKDYDFGRLRLPDFQGACGSIA